MSVSRMKGDHTWKAVGKHPINVQLIIKSLCITKPNALKMIIAVAIY